VLKAFPKPPKTTGFLVVFPLTTTGLVVGAQVHEHAVGLRVEVMAGLVVVMGLVVLVVATGLVVVAMESVGSLAGGIVVTVAFNISMAISLLFVLGFHEG